MLDNLLKSGFTKVKINGENFNIGDKDTVVNLKEDTIEVIIDRIVLRKEERGRIFEAIETSSELSNGKVIINVIDKERIIMSENYACPECDFSVPNLEPRIFSFNAPHGACTMCKGIGIKQNISIDLLIPDKNKSILEGAIKGFSLEGNIYMTNIQTVAEHFKIDLNKPIKTN